MIRGGNNFDRVDRMLSSQGLSLNGVSRNYIATFICPERYTYRRP
jgi:hypothetical protein